MGTKSSPVDKSSHVDNEDDPSQALMKLDIPRAETQAYPSGEVHRTIWSPDLTISTWLKVL